MGLARLNAELGMTTKPRLLLVLLALTAGQPFRALRAQARPELGVGSRIRVSTTAALPGHALGSAHWVVGTVRETDRTRLVLRVAGEGDESAYTIPWEAVQRLEISRGRTSSSEARRAGLARIALPAVVTGVAAGAIFGVLKREEALDDPDAHSGDVGRFALIGAGAGAVVGVLGTMATAVGGEEQWEPVAKENLAAGVAFRRGAVGLALQLRF